MIPPGRNLTLLNLTFWEIATARDYQGKRVNPWYRPCTQGNPCSVIFRHGAQFFTDVTRALRGCFRGGFVYVSFRFVSKQRKASDAVGMFSLIF